MALYRTKYLKADWRGLKIVGYKLIPEAVKNLATYHLLRQNPHEIFFQYENINNTNRKKPARTAAGNILPTPPFWHLIPNPI